MLFKERLILKNIFIFSYRKVNLYDDAGVRKPLIEEQVIFDTDFGVKFGIFTCFDILFRHPALELVQKKVENFVFPSMWYSELPFLTANQVQQSWAFANNVNLLAAGANHPAQSKSGSGIYSGTIGALTSLTSEINTTRVLTATISKTPGSQRPSQAPAQQTRDLSRAESPVELKLMQQDLSKSTVKVLPFAQNTTQIGELCHEKHCCKYEVEVIDRNQPKDAVMFLYEKFCFTNYFYNFYFFYPIAIILLCCGCFQRTSHIRWCEKFLWRNYGLRFNCLYCK